MGQVEETPRCASHVHVPGGRRGAEPTLVCSCAAGLIHMHDCPVMTGLLCAHYEERAEPEPVKPAEYEDLHSRLMDDFLSRPYLHRVRSLAPEGDEFQRRREELHEHYLGEGADAAAAAEELGPEAVERYESERDRLIDQRKRREEKAREREERTREEKAKERARMGIKTVVEKARDAVAAQGNVASSVVDDMKLTSPAPARKKRRRRRRGKSGGPEGKPAQGQSAPNKPKGEGAPKKSRRRRRRRRKPGEGSSS